MRRALATLLLVFAWGCSDPAPSVDGVGDPLPEPPPRSREVDPIYDNEGIPRESEVVIAGLTLPRGLEEIEELRRPRRRTFASTVPREPLLRYFGPRLTTLDIRHEGQRVTYAEARPRDARGGIVLLDVVISPSSARDEATRVEIVERPPALPEGTVVSEDEVRRRLEDLTEPRE